MKKLFALLVMILGIFSLATARASEGPGDDVPVDVPRIMQVRILPDGGLVALSPEKGGLYRSHPGGTGWRKLAVPEVFIHHLVIHQDGSIYLASDDGLFRSQGESWERVLEGSIASIHFSPDGAKVLIKAWGRGVYMLDRADLSTDTVLRAEDLARRKSELEQRSRSLMTLMAEKYNSDNATQEEVMAQLSHYRQWQEAQSKIQVLEGEQRNASMAAPGLLPDESVTCAAMTGEGVWLAGTFGHGIFGARPGHREWLPLSTGLASRWIMSMATAPWGTVYAGTYGGGLWVWRADQSDWAMVSSLPAESAIVDMAFGREGQWTVATQNHGVFVSLDRGQTWAVSDVAAGLSVQSVTVEPQGQIWAGTWNGGLYVSADQGSTWRHRPFAHVVRPVALAFDAEGTGYAALAGLGFFRSDDGGRVWTYLSTPVRPAKNLSLAVDGKGGILLGSRLDGLWRSEDQGRTWINDMRGLPEGGVNHVAVSPTGLTLAVPSDASGLFVRSDGGEWSLVPMADEDDWDYSVWETRFLLDGRYLAFGYQDLVVSVDSGRTWRRERFGQAFRSLAVDMTGAVFTERMMSTFVLGSESGERGWVEAKQIPSDAFDAFVPAGERLWLGAGLAGGLRFLEIQDGAMAVLWQGLAGQKIYSMAVSPDGAIFVGLEEGMMVTRDGGQTWARVAIGDE
jgi:photosystem II stability/assembly factor-like uncharacterized protein